MKTFVVTGVSTGIGLAIARVLLAEGAQVFGSVRKPEDADRLSKELGECFVPLLFDLTDLPAIQHAAQYVRAVLGDAALSGLVNNAGIAVPGPLSHLSIEDFRHQIDVNLFGAVAVTQAFLPLLGTERGRVGPPGRIVNISSTAGRHGGPFLGAYCASKHALEGYSESLRRELMLYGIDVVIVAPDNIVTPIWDKAEQLDIDLYAGTDYVSALKAVQQYMVAEGRRGLPAEAVGKAVWTALTVRRPRVRYFLSANRIAGALFALLPRRVQDRLIAGQLGFLEKPS